MPKIAIVQQAPVLLNRAATMAKAVEYTGECAAAGAELVVFPEAFIPGYPAWIWRLRPGGDMGLVEQLHARLFENAVSLANDDLAPLGDAARKHRVTIVCGVNERDEEFSRTTLYNTVVTLGPDGSLLNRHRKLMPTNAERMVWGFGDATGLNVVDTPCGRVGALICWENYMPQARLALYALGVEVYIAPTFDDGDAWVASMQHIAREGRCWVLGGGFALKAEDIPDDFPEKGNVFPDASEWVNPGDSVIVAPGGAIVEGPLRGEYGVLYADIDIDKVVTSRRALDVAGHYARPDIFRLHVNDEPLPPVVFGTEQGFEMGEEIFEVVDEQGRVLGTAPRGACHSDPSLIHQSVHVLVVDGEGQLFLQKRSRTKDIQPGKWDTSVGGHMQPGETPEQAAAREMEEELGVKPSELRFVYEYLWRTDVETELVRTFVTMHPGPFELHPEEIDEGRFWSTSEIEETRGQGHFTPNFEVEFERFRSCRT